MKRKFKTLLFLSMLVASLGLISATRVTAQTFTTLHTFTGIDGVGPQGLILLGDTLYGTGENGGLGYSTVFGINIDGTGFTNLYNFTGAADGSFPKGNLISSGSTLYGTAQFGGSSGEGTVFAVNTNGSGFTVLHSFTALQNNSNSDGALPGAGLILLGNTLYGTTQAGGDSGNGTVFAVGTNGTAFTTVHSFSDTTNDRNSDGAAPSAGLSASGDTLYGTASGGGSSGLGTVFAVKVNGTGFTTLNSFSGGSNGIYPSSNLIILSNTLYGTAFDIVFKVNTDGKGFATLHDFSPATDGHEAEFAGLLPLENTLYGTTYTGGAWNQGTVFAVNTDSIGFINLHSFTALSASSPLPGFPWTNSDGAMPASRLISSHGALYGTTSRGGAGVGTIFSISLPSISPPQLTIIPFMTDLILTWPTNAAGFTLQSATSLASPAVWTGISPAALIVNGQYVVTNSISNAQTFYRLSL